MRTNIDNNNCPKSIRNKDFTKLLKDHQYFGWYHFEILFFFKVQIY